MHNIIPEGLAVGVAFGALVSTADVEVLGAAIALSIGIGIQNFPEGAAISVPFYDVKASHVQKRFGMDNSPGSSKPIAGVIGAYLVMSITPLLPYALAFAAGAMIFVVVEEFIPSSQTGNETNL